MFLLIDTDLLCFSVEEVESRLHLCCLQRLNADYLSSLNSASEKESDGGETVSSGYGDELWYSFILTELGNINYLKILLL